MFGRNLSVVRWEAISMERVSADCGFAASVDCVRSVVGDGAGIELDSWSHDEEVTARVHERIAGSFEAMLARNFVDLACPESDLPTETSVDPPATGSGLFPASSVTERQRRVELTTATSLFESNAESQGGGSDSRAAGAGGD